MNVIRWQVRGLGIYIPYERNVILCERLKQKARNAFRICSGKGSEVPVNDPQRKMQGRCVIQGSDVRDENFKTAIFQELSSSPATLEAAKSVYAYGTFP
eukprot:15223697-Heterocapsa_arctica.AAC.1